MRLPPINPKNFLLKEVPTYAPFSPMYRTFWQEQAKNCIEGYWFSGRWMPGKLYFYVNFSTIRLNIGRSKAKVYSRPTLRDIEWLVFLAWEEARGFSGFEEDPYYSCDNELLEISRPSQAPDYLLTPEGRLKKYISPREYLHKTHKGNYGRPLYNNQAKNFMMMGPRGYGKALDPDTKVIKYPYKEVPIKDIEVGDLIYDKDGKPTVVLKKTKLLKGLKMYKFTFRVNMYVETEIYACEDHQWHVYDPSINEYITVTTKDIYKRIKEETKPHYIIERGEPHSGAHVSLPLSHKAIAFLFLLNPAVPKIGTDIADELARFLHVKNKKRFNNGFSYLLTLRQFSTVVHRAIKKFKEITNQDPTKEEFILGLPYEIRESIVKEMANIHEEYKDSTHIPKNARGKYIKFLKKYKAITPKCNKRIPYKLERAKDRSQGYCIEVSSPSKTYLIELNIVTHNSYIFGGGIIAHEYLFDGRTKYDPEEHKKNPSVTTILVGAGDAKYSNDILSKTKMTFDHLPGAVTYGDRKYPPPFQKKGVGSLKAGKQLVNKYRVKEKGTWVEKGTGTTIKNRTLKDNPYGFQGNRASIVILEEIGMFNNAREVLKHTEDVMQDGPSNKFGTLGMIGTGGAMASGGTLDAYYMFYHPDEFNLLKYDDEWEHRGDIAFFMPATFGNNKFKNEWGFTDVKAALEEEKRQRQLRTQKASSLDSLHSYIVYHPLVPSEIFLSSSSSLLPTAEIKRRKAELMENSKVVSLLEKIIELYYDPKSPFKGVSYKLITNPAVKPIREFPYKGKDKEGAIVMYEEPLLNEDGRVPDGLYVVSCDPIGTDSPDGPSLAAIYVMKTRLDPVKYGHNEIVAHYVGRPYEGRRVVNEILMKLALFYNAKVWFENNRGNVLEYFEKHKKLGMLAKHPIYTLTNKAAHAQMKGDRNIYGFSIESRKDRVSAIQYVYDWLLEERGTDNMGNKIRNVDVINDMGLLDEMTYYNLDGNFDRVDALCGCVLALEEMFNKYIDETTQRNKDKNIEFLINNPKLFKPNYSNRFRKLDKQNNHANKPGDILSQAEALLQRKK